MWLAHSALFSVLSNECFVVVEEALGGLSKIMNGPLFSFGIFWSAFDQRDKIRAVGIALFGLLQPVSLPNANN